MHRYTTVAANLNSAGWRLDRTNNPAPIPRRGPVTPELRRLSTQHAYLRSLGYNRAAAVIKARGMRIIDQEWGPG